MQPLMLDIGEECTMGTEFSTKRSSGTPERKSPSDFWLRPYTDVRQRASYHRCFREAMGYPGFVGLIRWNELDTAIRRP